MWWCVCCVCAPLILTVTNFCGISATKAQSKPTNRRLLLLISLCSGHMRVLLWLLDSSALSTDKIKKKKFFFDGKIRCYCMLIRLGASLSTVPLSSVEIKKLFPTHKKQKKKYFHFNFEFQISIHNNFFLYFFPFLREQWLLLVDVPFDYWKTQKAKISIRDFYQRKFFFLSFYFSVFSYIFLFFFFFILSFPFHI